MFVVIHATFASLFVSAILIKTSIDYLRHELYFRSFGNVSFAWTRSIINIWRQYVNFPAKTSMMTSKLYNLTWSYKIMTKIFPDLWRWIYFYAKTIRSQNFDLKTLWFDVSFNDRRHYYCFDVIVDDLTSDTGISTTNFPVVTSNRLTSNDVNRNLQFLT